MGLGQVTWEAMEEEESHQKKTPDICKTTLDIKFEQDWSVDLDAILGNSHTQN